MRKKLHLFVWENVLSEWTSGFACALAKDEKQAWEELKKTDETAWRTIRGSTKDDTRTPDELPDSVRPTRVDSAAAFTSWGGG